MTTFVSAPSPSIIITLHLASASWNKSKPTSTHTLYYRSSSWLLEKKLLALARFTTSWALTCQPNAVRWTHSGSRGQHSMTFLITQMPFCLLPVIVLTNLCRWLIFRASGNLGKEVLVFLSLTLRQWEWPYATFSCNIWDDDMTFSHQGHL